MTHIVSVWFLAAWAVAAPKPLPSPYAIDSGAYSGASIIGGGPANPTPAFATQNECLAAVAQYAHFHGEDTKRPHGAGCVKLDVVESGQ